MERSRIGSIDELRAKGCLTGKVGSQPVCVFWSDGCAYAVDDRCPHMGFPLHRGSVESGLLTCHWHHARFDLSSGGTLDPFADDVRAHDVEIEGSDVFVRLRADEDAAGRRLRRLEEGLEQGLTLVMAKAVLGLIELLGERDGTAAVLRAATAFGVTNRDEGWGAGLTVLTAMANVLPDLEPSDRPLALVHGLSFVSRDTLGSPPHFALSPLESDVPLERLASWYRRFVETRNGEAAERVLVTAARGGPPSQVAALMGAAVTDHLFLDGGHTADFTNKAFEMLEHLGTGEAPSLLPTLAKQTAAASRAEETGEWRYPHDLVSLLEGSQSVPGKHYRVGGHPLPVEEADALAWTVLGDDPGEIVTAIEAAFEGGADAESVARAVAYAASLRLVRFHTQNDHGDWDVVHHGFTTASAVHQMVLRSPTADVVRGISQSAMKVFLDRFLNVPAARSPGSHRLAEGRPHLEQLDGCFEREGMVDEAGAIVYGWLRSGGSREDVFAALGRALLAEDAEFHWFQTYEAAVRQALAWPDGSEQAALVLSGAARFLAAHTPTRRELAQVVRIASRLRRGEALYEEI